MKNNLETNRRKFIKTSLGIGAVGIVATSSWGVLEIVLAESEPDIWKKSVCRYCGVGCGVQVGLKEGKVTHIKGDDEASNKGIICIKGALLKDLYNIPNRLTTPKIRKNGKLVDASWEEALSLITKKFKDSIKNYGANSVAFYGSGQLVTEESYTANKLFKAGIRTNNVDGNPRLCMASAAVGYTQTFGKDEPAGSYEDLDYATCYFIIGANPYEAHPPLFQRILIHKKENPSIKIICVDPRKTQTASRSDIHLPITPGTDLLLLNAMAYIMVKENLIDKDFIQKYVNFNDGKKKVSLKQFVNFLDDYTPEKVAKKLDLPITKIYKVARLFALSKATLSLWTMGINQKIQGVFLNNTLNSLHLITGQICKPGATPLSLTGQGNACGGVRDTGSLSHILPNGRFIKKKKHRNEVEKLWNVAKGTISPQPGYDAVNLFRAMKKGKIKATLIMCTNPAQSMPNLNEAIEGMKKTFIVLSDIISTSQTAQYANVILPTTLWIEREGVKGQTERRYQLVEKIKEPPKGVKSDLEILVQLSKRLGYSHLITAKTPQQVWDEWRKFSAHSSYNFEGITYRRLRKERGLQWPCPTPQSKGTVRRYLGGDDPLVPKGKKISFYGKKDGKAVVFLRPYKESPEKVTKEYPFYLTTGRVISQWHTGTMTYHIKELKQDSGKAKFYIHPIDAKKKKLKENNLIKVWSRYGEISGQVHISDETKIGVLFASFYDSKFLINKVVADYYDPISKEPEYKITAINFQKA